MLINANALAEKNIQTTWFFYNFMNMLIVQYVLLGLYVLEKHKNIEYILRGTE